MRLSSLGRRGPREGLALPASPAIFWKVLSGVCEQLLKRHSLSPCSTITEPGGTQIPELSE